MANYEYKCVAVPDVIKITEKGDYSQAIKTYQDLINQETADGWKLVNVDTVSSYYKSPPPPKAGCFKKQEEQKPDQSATFKLLIFERQK